MSLPTTDGAEGNHGANPPEHDKIEVVVFAPKHPDPKHFTFRAEELVSAAAKEAAIAFGYTSGNPSFQVEDGSVLDRTVTLRAAGVHDGEKLELVDAGGGV
jgi:hypothetical protein